MTAHRAKGAGVRPCSDPRRRRLAGSGDDGGALRRHDPGAQDAHAVRVIGGGIPSPVSWTAWCCARGPKRTRRSRRRTSDLGRRPGDDRALWPGRYAPRGPAPPARSPLSTSAARSSCDSGAVTARVGAGRCLGCRGRADVVEVPATAGQIVAVRVAAMMVRHAQESEQAELQKASRGSWCCRRSSTCRGGVRGSGWEAADPATNGRWASARGQAAGYCQQAPFWRGQRRRKIQTVQDIMSPSREKECT